MDILPNHVRRPLGGREVCPVGLGCMSLAEVYGPPPSAQEAARLLDRALDCGYDHLDTARIYGLGLSEQLIGDALHTRRKSFYLASKTGIFPDGDMRRIDCRPEMILGAVEESLRLLRTDHIDLYYLHRRDFTVPIEDSVGALADLVRAGKIGGIGLSEMSAATLRRAHAVHPITAMQTEYSLWTRQVEIAVLDACRELGVALVAFSPLGRGALAGSPADPANLGASDLRHQFPRLDAAHWPHNRDLIAQLGTLAGEAGLTRAQLCLAWVLSRGGDVHTIPGTASLAHLEENIATLRMQVDADILARAGALISPQTVSGPRYPPNMQKTIDTEDYASGRLNRFRRRDAGQGQFRFRPSADP